MGRGATNKSSALIFAPRPRTEPRLSPAQRAERTFARRLQEALDTFDGGAHLDVFLQAKDALLLAKRADPAAEDYAQRLIETMIGHTPVSIGRIADDPLLQHYRHTATFIARAGCRLSPETREKLAEVWITSDLRAGDGHRSIVEHLDFLVRRTSLERVTHKVVHRQVLLGPGDRKQASHYAHSDPNQRVACGRKMESLKMNWSNGWGPGWDVPSCRTCAKLGAADSPKIRRHQETTEELYARRFEEIAEQARERVAMSVMRPPRTAPEDFIDQSRRDAWACVVRILAGACSEADKHLDAATQSRLRRLWTPTGPEGWSPGALPAVAF